MISKVNYKEQYVKFGNFKNILFSKISIKHEFSNFLLFSKIILLETKDKNELNIKGKWINKRSLENLPVSTLTKKIVSYCFEELSSLNKFL